MQRIERFFAVLRSLDMSLLIFSRRQRYNKVWKQQNNLKRNIKKPYDKGENLTPSPSLTSPLPCPLLRSSRGKLRERSTNIER